MVSHFIGSCGLGSKVSTLFQDIYVHIFVLVHEYDFISYNATIGKYIPMLFDLHDDDAQLYGVSLNKASHLAISTRIISTNSMYIIMLLTPPSLVFLSCFCLLFLSRL